MPRLLCCLAAVLFVNAQQPRDPSGPPLAASGVIRGSVVDEVTAAPLAAARVHVFSFPTPGLKRYYRSETLTSQDGGFEFTGVPAGDFVITAGPGEMRASHLPGTFGDEAAVRGAKPSLHLASGEMRENVRIPLSRSLAIEGHVVNEFGEAMSEVSVSARSDRGQVGREARTDDRGYFRVFGLRPGVFNVCAEPENRLDVNVTPPRLRYAQACGKTPVEVKTGETPAVALQLHRTTAYFISGSLMNSDGVPVDRGRVRAVRRTPFGRVTEISAEVRSGRFLLGGLVSGNYVLRGEAHSASTGSPSPPLGDAVLPGVRIEGADVEGIDLTVKRPVTIRGRVTVSPGASLPRPSDLQVRFTEPLEYGDLHSPVQQTARVKLDGSFEMNGVTGMRGVELLQLPPAWFVDAVHQGGEDIRDRGRDFADDPRPIEIVLSDRSASVLVHPRDDQGQPAAAAEVVLFPADSTRWSLSPYLNSVRPAALAEFRGRRPGDYLVAALPPGQLRRWLSETPSLEAIARLAHKVTLRRGERVEIDLPVRSLEAGK